MKTFLKSKVRNIYSSTPCRCIGIYFGDYSNPFEEAAEESMVTMILSRSQLHHYGDPFKKQWRYYKRPFQKVAEAKSDRNNCAEHDTIIWTVLSKSQWRYCSNPSQNQRIQNLISTFLLRLMLRSLQRSISRLATRFCLYNALENGNIRMLIHC